MTCPHCTGPVEVVSGSSLRCACGRTTRPQPPVAPATSTSLVFVLETMVKYKALRVRAGDLEVELSPEAFAPQWPAQSSSLGNTEEKTCRCGHSVEVEHNDAGQCLQGCEPDACADKAVA